MKKIAHKLTYHSQVSFFNELIYLGPVIIAVEFPTFWGYISWLEIKHHFFHGHLCCVTTCHQEYKEYHLLLPITTGDPQYFSNFFPIDSIFQFNFPQCSVSPNFCWWIQHLSHLPPIFLNASVPMKWNILHLPYSSHTWLAEKSII